MKAQIKMMIAMLIFGSIAIFVKQIHLPSSEIALVRGIIGSIFLFTAGLVLHQRPDWKAIRPNLLLLLLSGAGIGFNWILLFEAYRYTTIANATLSYYCAPVFIIFLSPLILKEKLSPIKAIAVIGTMAGMFLVVGSGSGGGESNRLLGIAYGLSAAVLYAGVVLMNKFIKNLSGLETTLVQIGMASLVLTPYVLFTQAGTPVILTQTTVITLLIVGIVHTGFAYLMYFTSMKGLKGQTVALLSYIDPISAVLLSGMLLNEKLSPLQIAGAVLILGTTCFSELFPKKSQLPTAKAVSMNLRQKPPKE